MRVYEIVSKHQIARIFPGGTGYERGASLSAKSGLVATALASAVLISYAAVLASYFRWAMAAGAGTAVAIGACAFLWLMTQKTPLDVQPAPTSHA